MLLRVAMLLLQVQTSDDAAGYRLTLPPGFVEFPEGAGGNAAVKCWAEETADSSRTGVVMCVKRLGVTLPRDLMTAADVKPGTTIVSYRWHAFDIQGFRTHASRDSDQVFVLDAHVPLKKEAIQLTYAGPVDQEARGDSLMKATLASLEGESNWLTREQRAEKLGEVVGGWIAAIVGIFVLWRVYKWRARRDAQSAAARRPPPPKARPPVKR